ncbi:MAG: flagellin [Spirochaetaceae bacterium]
MIINHNMAAVNSNRQLGLAKNASNNSMEKLSSGMRINKAADDASGLAVSEKMRSQIKGLNQAERNIQNGVSFIQATEGFLNETTDILQRVRELSVQSSNGIYSDEDRAMIQVEVSQLVDEVNRIASHAQFNGMNMLTGRFSEEGGNALSIQVGANMDQSETIAVRNMTASALGLTNEQEAGGSLSLASTDEANKAIGILDDAMKQVNAQRANLGAYQNRFETAAKGIAIASENMQAAESRIRDTDMATEVVSLTRDKILSQASTAMLGQANVQTQSVLSLLN